MLRYAYTACLLTKTGSVYCAVRTEYSDTSQVCLILVGRSVGPRLLTAEAGVRSQVCGGQSCTGTGFLWVLRSWAVSVFPAMLHNLPHLIIACIREISWWILRFFQQTPAMSDIGSFPDQVLSLFAFQAYLHGATLEEGGSARHARNLLLCCKYRVMWRDFEIGHWVERTTGLALQVALWNSRLC
jgi:hypothetical protein